MCPLTIDSLSSSLSLEVKLFEKKDFSVEKTDADLKIDFSLPATKETLETLPSGEKRLPPTTKLVYADPSHLLIFEERDQFGTVLAQYPKVSDLYQETDALIKNTQETA